MEATYWERLAVELAAMDRPKLIDFLRTLSCTFPIDFNEDFFNETPLEKLRHIALAASLHSARAA
jgi:hypothetical protein